MKRENKPRTGQQEARLPRLWCSFGIFAQILSRCLNKLMSCASEFFKVYYCYLG